MKKTTVFAIGAAAGCVVCAAAAIAFATRKKTYQEVSETNCPKTTASFLRSVKEKGAKVVKKIKGEEELSEEELRARIEEARAKIAKRQQEMAAAGA